MVVFSPLQVFISTVSALLYGVVFAIITNFASTLFDLFRLLFFISKWDDKMQKAGENDIGNISLQSRRPIAITFWGIVLFGIGFSVISFITLDGNIRLYTLLASILGWYLSEILILSKLRISILNAIRIIVSKLTKLSEKLRLRCKNAHFFKKSQKNALTNDHSPP